MVQVIGASPLSQQAAQVGEQIGGGLAQALGQYQQQKQQRQQQSQLANLLFGDQGQQYKNLPIEAQLRAAQLQAEQNKLTQKSEQEQQIELRDYGIIKDNFGKKFADVWRAAPQGGRTELVKSGVDALVRGENLEDLLKGVSENEVEDQVTDRRDLQKLPHATEDYITEEVPQIEDGQLPKGYKYPDFSMKPKGFTPKEWMEEKRGWRKENAPLFTENKKKLSNTKRDKLSTKNLDKLNKSEKLPKDLGRLMIDPETGDLRTYAQLAGIASPETQQWVKEIARFQNRAKDAFGSRVTNFDLMSFMKQFPNLLNTQDGRQRILEMIKINYELDELYQNSLDQVYKKYGLGNIPQESADELAQKLIEKRTTELEKDYLRVSEGVEVVKSLENKGYKKGDKAANPKTGEKYIFNGQEWIKSE